MKGSDFTGNYLFCPWRESLQATMTTIPGWQQRYKRANQSRVSKHSISLSECMKEVKVMLLDQSPELKTKELRLHTCTYYLTEHNINFLLIQCNMNATWTSRKKHPVPWTFWFASLNTAIFLTSCFSKVLGKLHIALPSIPGLNQDMPLPARFPAKS